MKQPRQGKFCPPGLPFLPGIFSKGAAHLESLSVYEVWRCQWRMVSWECIRRMETPIVNTDWKPHKEPEGRNGGKHCSGHHAERA